MIDTARKQADAHRNNLANEAALSEDELNSVAGGMRKSAGNQASGVMFLAFTFKLVAV